jgi:glyoxylase-like metal-dependent hydrolase (beta-lactamase superfamily II)
VGAGALPLNQILPGLWRFEATHPEWTEEEGGEEGWDPVVAWWALEQSDGLVLIDPLVADWSELDRLAAETTGIAGVIRTIHWHQRSIDEVAARYACPVWAKPPPEGVPERPFDRAINDGDELFDGLRATSVERDDEIALWLPEQRALLFGDAMLRRENGQLRVCPDSWLQPEGGPDRLRQILLRLAELPVEHALVSHGPLVVGDGSAALRQALA